MLLCVSSLSLTAILKPVHTGLIFCSKASNCLDKNWHTTNTHPASTTPSLALLFLTSQLDESKETHKYSDCLKSGSSKSGLTTVRIRDNF